MCISQIKTDLMGKAKCYHYTAESFKNINFLSSKYLATLRSIEVLALNLTLT